MPKTDLDNASAQKHLENDELNDGCADITAVDFEEFLKRREEEEFDKLFRNRYTMANELYSYAVKETPEPIIIPNYAPAHERPPSHPMDSRAMYGQWKRRRNSGQRSTRDHH